VTSEGGLTDAGRALVRACEELGILVDLSHLNERSFWDVAAIASARWS
jgi:membrane dipeptidase